MSSTECPSGCTSKNVKFLYSQAYCTSSMAQESDVSNFSNRVSGGEKMSLISCEPEVSKIASKSFHTEDATFSDLRHT